MNLSQNQKIIVFIAIGVVLLFALVFLGILPGLKSAEDQQKNLKGEITFWGVFDKREAYQSALDSFKRKYPNLTISYRQFNDAEDYRKTLIDALAAGTGPDVFMIHSNDLYRDFNKISPAPAEKISLLQVQNIFPQIVEADFAPKGIIYALPLSVDTLSLIYNRDLLDAAAVPVPDTWDKFIEAAKKLTKSNAQGVIEISGAAIGGSTKTIDTATDILSMLMLQSGTLMTNDDFSKATFSSKEGLSALTFYSQFSDPKKTSHTWSDAMPHYLDALSREKVAMILDYSAVLPQIKFRNNFLNIGVAAVPQLTGTTKPIAYGNYWGYAVSRQTKRPDIVWDFVLNMTTSYEPASAYALNTRRPPALRELIGSYLNDAELGVFARQALIARSWAQVDRDEIKIILNNAIDAVINGLSSPTEALNTAQDAVNNIMSKRVQ